MMNTSIFSGKRVMITGGTGSWGNTLIQHLLELNVGRIVVFSRGELKQVETKRKFNNPKLYFHIGDVRDAQAVKECITVYDPDYIFHLAALKHVPICENQPEEAIKTNVLGTLNLVNACRGTSVKKFVLVSTDKAVNPINTYGMTKGLVEKIVLQANFTNPDTEYLCVRAGNVLGSNGSLIHYVKECSTGSQNIGITDYRMTRFFLTLKRAINLLLFAAEEGFAGETYVMKMPAFTLKTVVEALTTYYNIIPSRFQETGALPGEKLHEVLISETELPRIVQASENLYMIKPERCSKHRFHIWEYEEFRIGGNLTKPYSSEQANGTKEQFMELLKQGGF